MSDQARTTGVGLQLYSLDGSDEDLPAIIHRVAERGYQGVEFADRIHEESLQPVKRALAETGLEPFAAHVSLSQLESDLDGLVDRLTTLGCTRFVIPHIGSSHFLTGARVDALADRLNTVAEELSGHGCELLIHNTRRMHYPLLDQYQLDGLVGTDIVPSGGWQYASWMLDGVTPSRWDGETGFERLVARTDPTAVTFEIDTKEVQSAGRELVSVLDLVGDRVTAVHVSNARRTRRLPPAYQPSGIVDGIVEVGPAVQTALDHGVDWLIVESEDPGETLSETSDGFETDLAAMDWDAYDRVRGRISDFGRDLESGQPSGNAGRTSTDGGTE